MMKKVLALVIAVILLSAMTPIPLAADPTVYVSVSVDGKLEVAAQPVTVTDMTVQGAIVAAHTAYFSGGESGYAAGIDKTYNMFLITKAWGVSATPYVIVNGAPLGSDPSSPSTADVAPVKAGDNIIIFVSSDPAKTATPVSLTSTVSGGTATVTATAWTLDFTTFTYKSAPLANTAVIDPATGASLGTTDASGSASVTPPASGVVAISGLAAINVNAAAAAPAAASSAPAPAVSTAPAAGTSAAPAAAPASGTGATIYVTVSVDGKLQIAAKPVTVGDLTVQGAIVAAHKEFFSGGESGYAGGIDKTYNMFLITKAWGVSATPYVILNGAPLGSDPANPATADVAPVKDGDNLIISVSSNPAVAARAVALAATVADGKATVTATEWILDFTTFAYSSAPLANAAVVDPDTGTALGTTDANGTITVDVPAGGNVAIDGFAAINVAAASANAGAAPAAPAPAAPAAAPTPIFYPPTTSLLIAMAIIVPPVLIVIIIKMVKQSRLDKKAAASKK